MIHIISISRHKRAVALFLLNLFLTSLCAAPGGPAQPESTGFTPISWDKHVDHFSGNFTYNIPLMDIDGFPLNISYSSNISPEEEASWVGLGWTLNPGSVNRTLKGLPDEFRGDTIIKEMTIKDNLTIGGGANVDFQIYNFEPTKFVNLGTGIGLGVGAFYNTYNGFGTQFSLGPTINVGYSNGDGMTGGLTGNAGLSFTSNSQKGLSTTTSYGLSGNIGMKEKGSIGGIGIGSSTTTNNRNNVKQTSNRLSITARGQSKTLMGSQSSNEIPSIMPSIRMKMKTEAFAFNASLGGDVFGLDIGAGMNGYSSNTFVDENVAKRKAYGYFHSEYAVNDENAVMDLVRENDVPYHPELPYLAMPVSNYDLFNVNSHNTNGQFRAYRTSSGIYKEPNGSTSSISRDFSGNAHIGNLFSAGATYSQIASNELTKKWNANFNTHGDFKIKNTTNPIFENYYLKNSTESAPLDMDYYKSIGEDNPVNIELSGSGANFNTTNSFIVNNSGTMAISNLAHNFDNGRKNHRNTLFNFMTHEERILHGLDKEIYSYPSGSLEHVYNKNFSLSTVDCHYKYSNHISEVTTTNTDGSRNYFGIPVYNIFQKDVTFCVGNNPSLTSNRENADLVSYVPGHRLDNLEVMKSKAHDFSEDNYFNKEIMPSYAHTWLLTGVVSPDYVDKTGDGISADDHGNAIKLNYTKMNNDFVWRTPDQPYKAKYNYGLLANNGDDKGSYSWGKREEWYMHSIESKTKIAVFYLSHRNPAQNIDKSNLDSTGVKSNYNKMQLDKIVLYSKTDIIQNNGDLTKITPIKTVHFDYKYLLGKKSNGLAKLTLTKVYFTYGKNERSKNNAYEFKYNNENEVFNVDKNIFDRWGKFKDDVSNPGQMSNTAFPYSTQDKQLADKYSKYFLLSEIKTPSGAQLNVNYESNDYSYVQDRRVSRLYNIVGFGSDKNGVFDNKLYNQVFGLYRGTTQPQMNNFLYFEVENDIKPLVNSEADIKRFYFEDLNIPNNNLKKILFKCKVKLNDKGLYENITGYAGIKAIHYYHNTSSDIKYGIVEMDEFLDAKKHNPINAAALRFMRNNLPFVTYPKSRIINPTIIDVIFSLIGSIGEFAKTGESFSDYAYSENFAREVSLDKSWVRLCIPKNVKYGGGARVDAIKIKDNWNTSIGSSNPNEEYGQVYEYKLKENGLEISSGVAANEPSVGGEENPLRQDITFSGPTGFFDNSSFTNVEMPIGVSFMPFASIGYSNVKVRSLASVKGQGKGTGHSLYQYYTAKDFPVKSKATVLQSRNVKVDEIEDISFFSQDVRKYTSLSQGYLVELNDMHGKQSGQSSYNENGDLISMTTNYYKVNNKGELVNEADLINEKNEIKKEFYGLEFDFYNDLRDHQTATAGEDYEVMGGCFLPGPFPIPWVVPFFPTSYEERRFKSAVTTKVINRKGILEKVVTIKDGSKVEQKNLVFDRNTGEPVVTTVNNEFKDLKYQVNFPAYWMEDRMGLAFKNINAEINGVRIEAGKLYRGDNPINDDFLILGDELTLNISNAWIINYLKNPNSEKITGLEPKYWVIQNPNSTQRDLILIDKLGAIAYSQHMLNYKVHRSGNRNLISSMPLASVLTTTNPIVPSGSNHTISINTGKVLNATGVDYTDESKIISNHEIPQTVCCDQIGEAAFKTDLNLNTAYYKQHVKDNMCTNFCTNNLTLLSPVYQKTFTRKFDNPNFSVSTHYYITNIDMFRPIADKNFFQNCFLAFLMPSHLCKLFDNFDFINGFKNSTMNSPPKLNFIPPITIGSIQYDITVSNCFYCSEGSAVYTVSGKPHNSTCVNSFMITVNLDFKCNSVACPDLACRNAEAEMINPFMEGIKGNWRPKANYQYEVGRNRNLSASLSEVRNEENYASFVPFVQYNGSNWQISSDPRWIKKEYMTLYDKQGQNLESNNILGIPQAVKKGDKNTNVILSSDNAKYGEITFYSFEDYKFHLPKVEFSTENRFKSEDILFPTINGDYNFFGKDNQASISNAMSHTGKHSYKVTIDNSKPSGKGDVVISKHLCPNVSSSYTNLPYSMQDNYSIVSNGNTFEQNFALIPGKTYYLSVWVNNTNQFGLKENVNNGKLLINYDCNPFNSGEAGGTYIPLIRSSKIIEGWEQQTYQFTVPNNAKRVEFHFLASQQTGVSYFDDLRIFPKASNMKSYVYDDKNYRLLSELDENNYASFFDYDDEGKLIRVRKETEKGILTIKESRQSLSQK